MKKVDLLVTHATELITLKGKAPQRGSMMSDIALIFDGAVAIRDGKVVAVGTSAEVERQFETKRPISAEGKVVTPGLVDPHTHLLFAGTREEEFEMRLRGVPYFEIAQRGGGIHSSVEKIRAALKDELKKLAKPRLEAMLRHGTTTAEVKSGYGLTLADELKCLEAIRELDKEQEIDLIPTFLGAHEVPKEYRLHKDEYIRLLIEEMIPVVAQKKLARFCDVFCEPEVFDVNETRRILLAAKNYGLQSKLHIDEFADIGGTKLAAELDAVSVDHLICTTEQSIEYLKKRRAIAVLLPGTSFFLGLGKYAPARRLIENDIPVALGSDFNPGTCPTSNLQLVMTLACTQLKMTPAEALTAVTLNAACAIGEATNCGSIEVGKRADLVIWDVPTYKQIPYFFGVNHVAKVIKAGKLVV